MTNLIFLLILTSLFIQGWDYATQYDPEWKPQVDLEHKNPFGDYMSNPEIFGFLRFYTGNFLFRYAKWILKPTWLCRICMSSVYGTPIFFTYNYIHPLSHSTWIVIFTWIFFCTSLAGLQRIISRIF